MRKMKRQKARAAMLRAGYHKMNRHRGPQGRRQERLRAELAQLLLIRSTDPH